LDEQPKPIGLSMVAGSVSQDRINRDKLRLLLIGRPSFS